LLVAYVDGDPQPAAIAQLVRDPNRSRHAEIAVAVADCYHGQRIGPTLVEFLAADARAAGIMQLTDTTQGAGAPLRKVSLKRRPQARQRTRGAAIAPASDASASWRRAAGASRSP
jgi:hypothetical protein